MTSKEELVETIKRWMVADSEIQKYQKVIKQKRQEKKELADKLVSVMKDNEIDCFDLSEGKLLYTKTKVKAPLSKKYLTECLERYFAQNSDVNSDEVCDYILDNRAVKENENIRHKPNKK